MMRVPWHWGRQTGRLRQERKPPETIDACQNTLAIEREVHGDRNDGAYTPIMRHTPRRTHMAPRVFDATSSGKGRETKRRRRAALAPLVLALASCAIAGADEPQSTPQTKPQWQRLLQGGDAIKATALQAQINVAERAEQYDKAIRLHQQLLGLRTAVQGPGHWETVNEKWALGVVQKVGRLPAERRAGWQKAVHGRKQAEQLEAKRGYAKAEPLRREYCRWCEGVFGQKHPWTASSYNNLALDLDVQRKYAEAQPLWQTALDLRCELLGEKHPDTSLSYNNLAYNLNAQGRYADAQPLYQKALDLRLELLGEKHPDTALSYNNLARVS